MAKSRSSHAVLAKPCTFPSLSPPLCGHCPRTAFPGGNKHGTSSSQAIVHRLSRNQRPGQQPPPRNTESRLAAAVLSSFSLKVINLEMAENDYKRTAIQPSSMQTCALKNVKSFARPSVDFYINACLCFKVIKCEPIS